MQTRIIKLRLLQEERWKKEKEFNCTPWKERKKKAWSNFEPFGLRALFRPGGSTASNSFKRSTRLGLCFSLGLSLASVLLHLQWAVHIRWTPHAHNVHEKSALAHINQDISQMHICANWRKRKGSRQILLGGFFPWGGQGLPLNSAIIFGNKNFSIGGEGGTPQCCLFRQKSSLSSVK